MPLGVVAVPGVVAAVAIGAAAAAAAPAVSISLFTSACCTAVYFYVYYGWLRVIAVHRTLPLPTTHYITTKGRAESTNPDGTRHW